MPYFPFSGMPFKFGTRLGLSSLSVRYHLACFSLFELNPKIDPFILRYSIYEIGYIRMCVRRGNFWEA